MTLIVVGLPIRFDYLNLEPIKFIDLMKEKGKSVKKQIPSLGSQPYAALDSKEGHINCKFVNDIRVSLSKHFENVFIFSMNDEVDHTGYPKVAHYLTGLCCSPKAI